MTPPLNTSIRRTTTFATTVLLLTAALTAISSSAQAAVPLLDIAYNSGGNIWTQRADGTKAQLTTNVNTKSWEYIPEVSPDGLQIAYTAKVPNSSNDAIWLMSIGGSNPHQVTSLNTPVTTSSSVTDRNPRWSPDGTRISFERDVTNFDALGNLASAKSDIVTLNVFSGFELTITNSFHNASGPAAWSPDNSRLVYWKTDTAGFSIIGADGSGEHPLSLQTPRYPSDPAWTTDGSTIYFDTDSVNGILYFTSTDKFATTLNAPAKNLTTGITDRNPHLTPDGKSVGFTSGGVITTITLADGTVSQQPPTGVTGFSFIPAPQPSGPPVTTATYVALGDSYSSGEGNAPFQPDSNSPSAFDACHRSDAAYGPLLDKDKGLGPMLFKACSGAVTQDFFLPNQSNQGEPAQTSWLSSQTKTVTLTVGGNDLGFPNVLDHCLSGIRPDDTFIVNPVDVTGCAKNKAGQQDIDDRLAVLAGKKSGVPLVGPPIHSELSVLEKIHQQAKNAHIYITGYPQLFGDNPKYYTPSNFLRGFIHGPGFSCIVGTKQLPVLGKVSYIVDFQDAKWMNAQARRLNEMIQGVVRDANKEGILVTYVAPQFDGHGLCDSQPSYFRGLLFQGDSLNPGSFHPNVDGQRLGYEAAFLKAMG